MTPDRAALALTVDRFVVQEAYRYCPPWLEVGELIAAGRLGACEAADRFDASRGVEFFYYAADYVREWIRRAIREVASPMYVPRDRIGRDKANAMRQNARLAHGLDTMLFADNGGEWLLRRARKTCSPTPSSNEVCEPR